MTNIPFRIKRMVGFGADSPDGHTRVSRGPHYEVIQGSEESHEKMRQWFEAINQRLEASGKDIDQLTEEEFIALARETAPPP